MGLTTGLSVAYSPLAEEAARWDDVLGIATFGGRLQRASLLPEQIPAVHVPIAPLEGGAVREIWRAPGHLESGERGAVRYRRNGRVVFGCIVLRETDPLPPAAGGNPSTLHRITEQAYREIFAALDALEYPHLLRVWNYFPEINLDTHGIERYRQFNSARRNALLAFGRELTGSVPAACALGSEPGSPLVIYFIATRTAQRQIENPRQVSAYQYPPQYGPKPAFSRASVLQDVDCNLLFISGTASIVGHETLHIGDVAAQTRETLRNIDALVEEANRGGAGRAFRPRDLAYKVYVRDATDLPAVQAELRSTFGESFGAAYFKADICRQELLVEIEATGRQSGLSGA
ncbi:MAG TPA: hypothetical protein VJQ47_05960 [Steroidobacteraceae bacterium]|nr:hypothetical protein [Steroidobacteraceae bacterium]